MQCVSSWSMMQWCVLIEYDAVCVLMEYDAVCVPWSKMQCVSSWSKMQLCPHGV